MIEAVVLGGTCIIVASFRFAKWCLERQDVLDRTAAEANVLAAIAAIPAKDRAACRRKVEAQMMYWLREWDQSGGTTPTLRRERAGRELTKLRDYIAQLDRVERETFE